MADGNNPFDPPPYNRNPGGVIDLGAISAQEEAAEDAELAAAGEQQNIEEASRDKAGLPTPPLFANGDASDAYANDKALYLSFYHLAANREVNFKAFITSFNQSLATDWAQDQVFGRNDPIVTFKSTTRKLGLAFQVPAASLEEASQNLVRANTLAQFMYPAYEVANAEQGMRANTLAKPPLMRIAFANLVRNPLKGKSASAKEAGLLVAINSLTVTPSFDDDGFFDPGVSTLYPQLITIDLDAIVVHERDLGWDATGAQGDKTYGFSNKANSQFMFGFSAPPTPPLDGSAENPDSQGDEAVGADLAEEQANQLDATEELGASGGRSRGARRTPAQRRAWRRSLREI